MLTKQGAEKMLSQVPPRCTECHADIRRNYCRDCEVFCTEFHEEHCSQREHVGHRGYDENAPTLGDGLKGHLWEVEHGSYRIDGTRGPVDPS